MNDNVWFRHICQKNGFLPTDEQLAKLDQYVLLLLDWNKKINLISRKDEENVWESHILASVSILFKLRFPDAAKVIDIGSGGGLPGIPLRILVPNLTCTLVDATQKKINAVKEIIHQLGLTKIEAIWGRAEELNRDKKLNAQYDIAISRAVGPMVDLVKWSKPFLKLHEPKQFDNKCIPPGSIVMLKGGDLSQEVAQLKTKFKIKQLSIIPLTFEEVSSTNMVDKKAVVVIP